MHVLLLKLDDILNKFIAQVLRILLNFMEIPNNFE